MQFNKYFKKLKSQPRFVKFFSSVFLLGIIFLFLAINNASPVGLSLQSDDISQGIIYGVVKEEEQISEWDGSTYISRILAVELLDGPEAGKLVEVQTGGTMDYYSENFQIGDKVLVYKTDVSIGTIYAISDFVRFDKVMFLLLVFVVLVLVVSGFQGMGSLVSMFVSVLVVIFYVIPNISNGQDPIIVSLITTILLVPCLFFLSHGFQIKTLIAVIGTLVSVTFTILLAIIFIELTHLKGVYSDEIVQLQVLYQGALNLQGLLLAGIIIGTLGVVDDVTVSQVSIVQELDAANKKFSIWELFARAMNVGRDHIATLVNTLFLAYTGVSLPILLILLNSDRTLVQILNSEILMTEVVRTLVSSIGIVLTVPITTILASWIYKSFRIKVTENTHFHDHSHHH